MSGLGLSELLLILILEPLTVIQSQCTRVIIIKVVLKITLYKDKFNDGRLQCKFYKTEVSLKVVWSNSNLNS